MKLGVPASVRAGRVSAPLGQQNRDSRNSNLIPKPRLNRAVLQRYVAEVIFLQEIKEYSLSPAEITAYLEKADKQLAEKERLLAVQENELQKAKREIARVYELYQGGQLDTSGFGKFYKPLEERQKQLEKDIPRLQAEIDLCKVNNLSAEEVASEAVSLHTKWPTLEPEERRQLVEAIVEKIVVGKDEVAITLCYLPSCKELAKGVRKGTLLRPCCPLVITGVRVDSPPLTFKGLPFPKALQEARLRARLSRKALARMFNVDRRTLRSWERGLTKPNKAFWPAIKALMSSRTTRRFRGAIG